VLLGGAERRQRNRLSGMERAPRTTSFQPQKLMTIKEKGSKTTPQYGPDHPPQVQQIATKKKQRQMQQQQEPGRDPSLEEMASSVRVWFLSRAHPQTPSLMFLPHADPSITQTCDPVPSGRLGRSMGEDPCTASMQAPLSLHERVRLSSGSAATPPLFDYMECQANPVVWVDDPEHPQSSPSGSEGNGPSHISDSVSSTCSGNPSTVPSTVPQVDPDGTPEGGSVESGRPTRGSRDGRWRFPDGSLHPLNIYDGSDFDSDYGDDDFSSASVAKPCSRME